MALTNAEIEFMAKTTASLRSIDKTLGRIADALEKWSATVMNQLKRMNNDYI